MKLFKVQLPVYLASSIFSIIAGYILIPKLGLMGAAYVFTSTSFIQCCLLAGFMIYSLKDKLWFSKSSIASS
jgi:O-antigen/teichoic acid export membrane protein